MGDDSGTSFSQENPCGVTKSEDRAKEFVKNGEGGYFSSYLTFELEE